MIVVDSSVWIDNLRDRPTPEVLALRHHIKPAHIIVGDLVLLEVLRGARDESQAEKLRRYFARFFQVQLLNPVLAVKAAANYRLLRSRGISIRKTVDLVIATFCIEHEHSLLHSDRDFTPFVQVLGLDGGDSPLVKS